MKEVVITKASDDVRVSWGSTLDSAYVDRKDVIITRHNKPIATVVNYTKWEEMRGLKERVQRLERLLCSQQRYARRHIPGEFLNEEEYQAALKAAGLEQ